MAGIVPIAGGGNNIDLSRITATTADVLASKKFIDNQGVLRNGDIASYAGDTEITPDSSNHTLAAGIYLPRAVTFKALQTQSKTVTPARLSQTVKPDAGKYLSQVTVEGINYEYINKLLPSGGKITFHTNKKPIHINFYYDGASITPDPMQIFQGVSDWPWSDSNNKLFCIMTLASGEISNGNPVEAAAKAISSGGYNITLTSSGTYNFIDDYYCVELIYE